MVYVRIPTDKNPVPIGPLLSEHGLIRITGKDILRRLSEVQQEYPMDYGALADLETHPITIDIESAESLQHRIKNVERFYPENAVRLRVFGSKAVFLPKEVRVVALAPGRSPRIVIPLGGKR
jgi:hypothetical protein